MPRIRPEDLKTKPVNKIEPGDLGIGHVGKMVATSYLDGSGIERHYRAILVYVQGEQKWLDGSVQAVDISDWGTRPITRPVTILGAAKVQVR